MSVLPWVLAEDGKIIRGHYERRIYKLAMSRNSNYMLYQVLVNQISSFKMLWYKIPHSIVVLIEGICFYLRQQTCWILQNDFETIVTNTWGNTYVR